MSTSRTLVAASRPLLRQQPFLGTAAPFRFAGAKNGFSTGRTTMRSRFGSQQQYRQQQKSYQGQGKRWSSTTAEEQASWFKRMWDSPIGLKTVHFWAPVLKWILVLAGISDFARPAEKLSLTQNAALTATGLIWTRWCLIIKPKNYLLAAVNFFLGCVGVVQLTRIGMNEMDKKGGVAKAAAEVKAEAKEEVAEMKEKVKKAV